MAQALMSTQSNNIELASLQASHSTETTGATKVSTASNVIDYLAVHLYWKHIIMTCFMGVKNISEPSS